MSESQCTERTSRRMTGVARKIGRDVIGRFEGAGGTTLNMTLRATARRHVDMGKTGAHPRGGTVAGVTGLIGDHVIRWLALGGVVVMTLLTLVKRYTDMAEIDDAP